MRVGGRLLLYLVVIWSLSFFLNVRGGFVNSKERRKRHIFPLLSYLHGYKIGQNFALQLPSFVLSPVIIVPSVNQQQSVSIQTAATDESFQENGATFQTIIPAKLILNSTLKELESNLETAFKNGTFSDIEITNDLNDTFRQISVESSTHNATREEEVVSTTERLEITETEKVVFEDTTITTIQGLYPTPVYNNELINSLQLTTSHTMTDLLEELPELDNKWQNFTVSKNATDIATNISNLSEIKGLQESASDGIGSYRLAQNDFQRPNTRYYNLFPSSLYTKVHKFPITTNSYTEEESPLPRQDDRWHRFSSLSKVVPTSGFKPLAGLYYDGFLHKSPTKKTGFIPFDKYYYY